MASTKDSDGRFKRQNLVKVKRVLCWTQTAKSQCENQDVVSMNDKKSGSYMAGISHDNEDDASSGRLLFNHNPSDAEYFADNKEHANKKTHHDKSKRRGK